MRQDIRVLDRVRGAYASLRPSEQRVADYVLKDPETCTRCTISELADQVQVSQPTVIRFVQALGFDGYRNFKYCLIRDRSGGAAREACFDHLGGFDLKPAGGGTEVPVRPGAGPGRADACHCPDHRHLRGGELLHAGQ